MSDLILVADDDRVQCALLGRWLREADYEVRTFGDGADCLAELDRTLPSTICLDLAMPGLDGLETLQEIRRRDRQVPVIILTADPAVDKVVAAMQLGAYDYLVKPADRGRLLTAIRNATGHFKMTLRIAELEREAGTVSLEHGIIGRSSPMKRLLRQIDRVAASDITVLIHGESGSGKELVARAIHVASARGEGPLVALNCAAVPESLQESEFFGHERGSFTGATERRKGRIEMAHRGTLFLDEIGELSPSLQAKLLRVLQERTFQRVGGSTELHSDFRLVAATHRDLNEDVRQGRFREDLFFRIAVFELEVPPLRDRGEDILLLAQKFLSDAAQEAGEPTLELAPEVAQALLGYAFPGNVRELQNAMERAHVNSDGAHVELKDLPQRFLTAIAAAAAENEVSRWTRNQPLPPAVASGPRAPGERESTPTESAPESAPSPALQQPDPEEPLTLAELEARAIRAALERCGGNISAAARELAIDRATVYRKLRQLEGKAG